MIQSPQFHIVVLANLVTMHCLHVQLSYVDINECSDGIHSCEQVCNNTHGAHSCLCRDGYRLNSDGFSCMGKFKLLLQS